MKYDMDAELHLVWDSEDFQYATHVYNKSCALAAISVGLRRAYTAGRQEAFEAACEAICSHGGGHLTDVAATGHTTSCTAVKITHDAIWKSAATKG